MSEEKKDFVIKDQRAFTGENENTVDGAAGKDETSEQPKGPPKDEDKEKSGETTGNGGGEQAKKDYEEMLGQLPQINFSTFIFSLNSSVYVQLGLIEEPGTGKKTKNLVLAKQTIDILGMLEEKTKGNLTNEEENLLKNFLFDLRMKFIKETK